MPILIHINLLSCKEFELLFQRFYLRNKTLTYIYIADNDSQYRTMDHQERRENIINIAISGNNIDVKRQCDNFYTNYNKI